MQTTASYDALEGCLLGAGVGDSLGLVRENLSAHRAASLYGKRPLPQRMLFGRWGFFSDDTEHVYMTAVAFRQAENIEQFRTLLAGQLRHWIKLLPVTAGSATVRSCWKLSMGVSSQKSGICSAGNGAAMRTAIIGAAFDGSTEELRQ